MGAYLVRRIKSPALRIIHAVLAAVLIIALAAITVRFIILPEFIYPKKYSNIVEETCAEYGMDENLIYAVIRNESRFNPEATSNKGAMGLMQLMEPTAEWCAEKLEIKISDKSDFYDPSINIRLGVWYLSKMIEQFGDLDLAIAAYNAGSGNVEKWLLTPEYSKDGKSLFYIPFWQTRDYLENINRDYDIYNWLY